MRSLLPFFAITALLFSALPALAAPVANAPYSNQEFSQRYFESSRLLNNQQKQAEYWEYGWGSFNGATLAYSTALAVGENNARKRNGNIVNAVESLVGLTDILLRPLPAFNADIVCSDIESPAQCLANKEALLFRSAARARDPYELVPHLANAGFNTVAGVVISQIGRTNDAFISGISGVIIGEVQLWTMPGGPINDADQYQMQFKPILIQDQSLKNPVMGFGFSWKL